MKSHAVSRQSMSASAYPRDCSAVVCCLFLRLLCSAWLLLRLLYSDTVEVVSNHRPSPLTSPLWPLQSIVAGPLSTGGRSVPTNAGRHSSHRRPSLSIAVHGRPQRAMPHCFGRAAAVQGGGGGESRQMWHSPPEQKQLPLAGLIYSRAADISTRTESGWPAASPLERLI